MNTSLSPNSAQNRTSFKIMIDSVHALLMRELKTRFGTSKLGYFWAIAEPVAQAAVLGLIFTLLGRHSVNNIPIALFIFTGLLPFKLFSKLLPQLSVGISANKALFAYRQVAPIDPIITRLLIELTTYVITYIFIMLCLGWLGFNVIPEQLLPLFAANALLVLLSIGLGISLCSAVQYWADTPKVLAMVLSPLFYLSGVFYSATMIPPQYWFLLEWNPIFHLIELSRDAYFKEYITPIGNWQYVFNCALVAVVLGLSLYRINRFKFVSQ
jgi:capsular polysaccharide transport system permease protein